MLSTTDDSSFVDKKAQHYAYSKIPVAGCSVLQSGPVPLELIQIERKQFISYGMIPAVLD